MSIDTGLDLTRLKQYRVKHSEQYLEKIIGR